MDTINVLFRRKYDILGILDAYKQVPIIEYKNSINYLVSKGKIKSAWNLVRATESFHIIADESESVPLYELYTKHFITPKLMESTHQGLGDTLDIVVVEPKYTLERILKSGRDNMGLIINAWSKIYKEEYGYIPKLKELVKYYNNLLADTDSLAIETQKYLNTKNTSFKLYALKYSISIPSLQTHIKV